MTTLEQLRSFAANANVAAFLRVIRAGESGQGVDAYRTMYGGGLFNVEAGWRHPNTKVTAGGYTSTAAGAYQFLARTWEALSARYGFADFSPGNQDLGAIALIVGRGAIADVLNGDLVAALPKCGREWASLPGSPYGQPTITPARCEAVFRQYGGQLLATEPVGAPAAPVPSNPVIRDFRTTEIDTPESPPITPPAAPAQPERKRMDPLTLISVFGPILSNLIPQVAKLFGGGSEVATRNVATASLVLDTVTKAAGAVNVQEAVAKMQADPALAASVQAAVVTEPGIMALLEVGGGIAVARTAAADPGQISWWKNPAVIVTGFLLPALYIVICSVMFDWGRGEWSDEIRTMVVTAVVSGLLGSITGFFLGSSMGSQKKSDQAAAAAAK